MTDQDTPPANPDQPTRRPSGGNNKTGPKKVTAAQKRAQAVELRKAGATFDEIATALGYSNKGTAYRAVEQALKEAVREPALQLIELEVQRLDLMLRALWPAVARGQLGAVDRALRVAERRARLLGLDAAQQIQHSGPGGGPIEVVSFGDMTEEEKVARLRELRAEADRRITLRAEETTRALVSSPAGDTDQPAAAS